jgi:hypothetical protein
MNEEFVLIAFTSEQGVCLWTEVRVFVLRQSLYQTMTEIFRTIWTDFFDPIECTFLYDGYENVTIGREAEGKVVCPPW